MISEIDKILEKLQHLKVAIIVPTYNNAGTLAAVIDSLVPYSTNIYVINDGSTDTTSYILSQYNSLVKSISYMPNKGKGYALKTGFKAAQTDGFDYAITLDSDGQHFASDIEIFVNNIECNPDTLFVGNRGFGHKNMAGKSTFANKFSNFWFHLQTLIDLPDTQSGYRLYPLKKMGNMYLCTNRYEAELELLVFSAWRGIAIKPLPISVYYAPVEERVSHFRPFYDFFRISILNTVLVFLALVYGYPSIGIRYYLKKIARK